MMFQRLLGVLDDDALNVGFTDENFLLSLRGLQRDWKRIHASLIVNKF